jgi:flavin-binding protein dodecin
LAKLRANPQLPGGAVPDHTYRVIEVVGSASTVDGAIGNAIERAARTTRHLDWFQVAEIRGHIEDGAVGHVQVGLKLGFRLEDAE